MSHRRKRSCKKVKNIAQVNILRQYYEKHPYFWKKSDVVQISQKSQLTHQQVYKWLWDKRNAKETLVKTAFIKKTKQLIGEKCLKIEEVEQEEEQTFISVSGVQIKVPFMRQSPVLIEVNSGVEEWARKILSKEGWQIIREPILQQKVSIIDHMKIKEPEKKKKVKAFKIVQQQYPLNVNEKQEQSVKN